ncbi:O-methyltransferase [Desulfosporosinus shakirovi]|uniref:O-methyltransferase n=1 Tax=Desulfosporosinus shakirovi TaxID=2885154 RepID=UPI001E606440|nr:O-methyltransferase [Desulfosporosinus sp. SRJS8]MCB8814723.1 hypothetical protein [Desulfosporosinus sp. SRJS8]
MGNVERQSINYYLRPAKSIERKFFCDIFRKLCLFSPINNYKYIGFGARYFIDFNLFHKELGIEKMISIEENATEEKEQERFEFNKPFKCIEMIFKNSSEAINQITWDSESIVWLDYDKIFSKSMLNDIKNVVLSMLPNSVILVTCNRCYSIDEHIENRFVKFKEEFMEDVPIDAKKTDIRSKIFHNLINKMINNKINEALIEKNRNIAEEEKKLIFKQLVYFTYKDGAPMITTGGIIIRKENETVFTEAKFYEFLFNQDITQPYDIYLPNLTYKELQKINSKMPCENWADIDLFGLNEEDLQKYMELYRYFPYYMESRFIG